MPSPAISGWHLGVRSTITPSFLPWNCNKVSLFMKSDCNLSIALREKLHPVGSDILEDYVLLFD